MRTRHVRAFFVLGIRRRCLHCAADAQIQSEARVNAEVVLGKERGVPGIGVAGDRGILGERTGQSEFEIRQGVPLRCRSITRYSSIKGESAVVVQQGLLNVFVKRRLAAELETMTPLVVTETVAGGGEIRARQRAGYSLRQVKEVRDGHLRK